MPPGPNTESGIPDGMSLPDCLRASSPAKVRAAPGKPGYAQTLSLPWKIPDPALQHLMRPDGVSAPGAGVRDLAKHRPERTSHYAEAE